MTPTTFDPRVPDTRHAGSDSSVHFRVIVLGITARGTRAALVAAESWSHDLCDSITILIPHVVPYPEPLEATDASVAAHARAIANEAGPHTTPVQVVGVACRSPRDLAHSLAQGTVVLVGGRPGFLGWRSAAERLTRWFTRQGLHGVFVSV